MMMTASATHSNPAQPGAAGSMKRVVLGLPYDNCAALASMSITRERHSETEESQGKPKRKPICAKSKSNSLLASELLINCKELCNSSHATARIMMIFLYCRSLTLDGW